ncbi:glutamine--fructose-6-phosphate transaminase (isomerizing) [Halorarius litoreus]|uniref:glutamine--fructose-6-phosphate transaminase (isomerizing) n=1 Tax=Halorarius litoreus TaxID=2962676 RepID=UPI0020CBBA04|nr:glutamine--fructose-6-phosphate transaminase (isomerizing) [Halorarius litoreus]
MCGIIACIGRTDTVDRVVEGLENLEYRGYDSAGIAVRNDDGVAVDKHAGKISELKHSIVDELPDGTIGIGHTRWSTHGPPTDANAHPHTGETGDVAVVHNGIIENYDTLRDELTAEGRTFTSDTDTEVVPHLIEKHLEDTDDVETAFRRAVDELDGSYAIVAVAADSDTVYAARQDSPLVVGYGDGCHYLASDVPAFLEHTDQVSFLEDGDVAAVTDETVDITDADGESVSRERETVDWNAEETVKGQYEHFMLKEIDSQPNAISNTLQGRIDGDDVVLEEFPEGTFADVSAVQFVACGTSYHAGLYAARLLNKLDVPATAHRASEYASGDIPVSADTLAVAVTQSGETADTLAALRLAQEKGAQTTTVTNVVGSTAAREVETPLYIRAGPEIGVAATKTFSSQVVTLSLLAERVAEDSPVGTVRSDRAAFLDALQRIPEQIDEVLERSTAEHVCRSHVHDDAYFFIGQGTACPVAKEGALKFKEITYEHAEGFAAGELKHGPLALVTPDTVVFAMFTGGDRDTKTLNNAKEVQARGADIVAVAPEGVDLDECTDEVLRVPSTHPDLTSLLTNVQLQLVSYHAANLLNREIDKPRNLAKSVTVE